MMPRAVERVRDALTGLPMNIVPAARPEERVTPASSAA
jgi:hypothetical protein